MTKITPPMVSVPRPASFTEEPAGYVPALPEAVVDVTARAYENLDRARIAAKPRPQFHLPVQHRAQKTKTGCFLAARAMVRRYHGSQVDPLLGPHDALYLASAEDSHGALSGLRKRFAAGLHLIDRYLHEGRPVLVGVSHSVRRINHDKITDHFLVIHGRGIDSKGRIFYPYLDPATSDRFRRGRLYVDKESTVIFRPPLKDGVGLFGRGYQVTQVRRYADDRPPSPGAT